VVIKGGKATYIGLHSLRHFYVSWYIKRKEEGGLALLWQIFERHRIPESVFR